MKNHLSANRQAVQAKKFKRGLAFLKFYVIFAPSFIIGLQS
jgi:hypothetical protein